MKEHINQHVVVIGFHANSMPCGRTKSGRVNVDFNKVGPLCNGGKMTMDSYKICDVFDSYVCLEVGRKKAWLHKMYVRLVEDY